MQYTIDAVLGSTSITNCDQWDSKFIYNVLPIGGNTKFSLLYIDFRNSIETNIALYNKIDEGSVRPPCMF